MHLEDGTPTLPSPHHITHRNGDHTATAASRPAETRQRIAA
jgi:hypothetical protein